MDHVHSCVCTYPQDLVKISPVPSDILNGSENKKLSYRQEICAIN